MRFTFLRSALNKHWLKLVTTAVVLATVYVGAALYRIRVDTDPEFYEARQPTAFYWTENAVQYHYAELVSQGRSIPAFDPNLQAPEGVKVFENLTILMEYPCGWLYRFLDLAERGIRFHTFTIFFMAFFASLTVFALYLGGRALGLDRPYSLLAAALGVFSYVSIGRSIQGFLNEDFSLPMFFLGTAFYLRALRADRSLMRNGLGSGFFLALSLVGWHFARFLFLGFVACACVNLWAFTADPADRRRQSEILFWLMVFPLTAGFLAPVLRSRGFFLAPALWLALGAVVGERFFSAPGNRVLIGSARGWKPIGIALAFAAVGVILSRIFKLEGDYTHVWSLLWNKLKFFGVKPALPGKLDFPARSLWIEAFNSPSARTFLMEFFPLAVAAVMGVVIGFKKAAARPAARLVLLLAALFFCAYLGIERLGSVANFFLALLAAGLGFAAARSAARSGRAWPAVFLAAVLVFNGYQGYQVHRPTAFLRLLDRLFRPEPAGIPGWRINNLDLVSYVRHESHPAARCLARYSVGPLVFAYAGQAIAIQPKFEVRNSRERVAEYYRGVYGTEEDLYALCRKWEIDYFLYDLRILLDRGRDSDRWVADRLVLDKGCAAFRLHFTPESLRHFELVYQNSNYRLYRVLDPGQSPVRRDFPESPVYDLAQYGGQSLDGRPYEDQWNLTVVERIRRAFKLIEQGERLLGTEPSEARRRLLKARELYPNLIGEATVLGTAEVLSGRIEEGLTLCRRETDDHPYFPLARYNLAYALYRLGDYPGARRELEQCLALDPGFEAARDMIRELGAAE